MNNMRLSGQRKIVYDYIKEHHGSTIREIRDATNVMKPDMRISEINFQHREEKGEDLIINVGKNRSREVLKALKQPLTRFIWVPEDIGKDSVRMVKKEVLQD